MPFAAPKPCTHIGCRALVHGGSRCEAHKAEAWSVPTRDATKRITGRRLQAMRANLFKRQPLCELCLARGHVTPATQRDHKVPLGEGGADDESNEQALCQRCHNEKSLAERLRGRGARKSGP